MLKIVTVIVIGIRVNVLDVLQATGALYVKISALQIVMNVHYCLEIVFTAGQVTGILLVIKTAPVTNVIFVV